MEGEVTRDGARYLLTLLQRTWLPLHEMPIANKAIAELTADANQPVPEAAPVADVKPFRSPNFDIADK
jgi:hypothetical protein